MNWFRARIGESVYVYYTC